VRLEAQLADALQDVLPFRQGGIRLQNDNHGKRSPMKNVSRRKSLPF
jgi:hypothetical protein